MPERARARNSRGVTHATARILLNTRTQEKTFTPASQIVLYWKTPLSWADLPLRR
jgi:hypothetical protein